jgi:hypothetical protein
MRLGAIASSPLISLRRIVLRFTAERWSARKTPFQVIQLVEPARSGPILCLLRAARCAPIDLSLRRDEPAPGL